METSNDWIVQRTGIEARYWVNEGEDIGTSDLAYEASVIALERAGWTAENLDLIVCATMTPDVNIPGSGAFLQHRLGAKGVPALDIRQQVVPQVDEVLLLDLGVLQVLEPALEPQRDVDADDDHQDLKQEVGATAVSV